MGQGPTLEEAYEKWAGELTRYATAIVGPAHAADVVADAFVSMLDGGARRWAAVADPRRYLFRAVTNAARMRERAAWRRTRRESRWLIDQPIGELLKNPEVIAAVAELSMRQRATVFLTYWEDLTPAGVAAVLNISEGAVRRHLARARSSLRKVLA